jgi:rare lipoprotein A
MRGSSLRGFEVRIDHASVLLSLIIGVTALAGCAQPSASRTELLAGTPQNTSSDMEVDSAAYNAVTKATVKRRAGQVSGLASFYSHPGPTASGERFDPSGMTAAHPSLPFGTRLRVTNLATGRSVTVRVNDRGPFVQGRIVDLSYSAAQNIGMVNRGLAQVKLEVVN